MKPFYKTSEFWINFASVLVGAIAASGQLLPSPLVQAAGLAAMALGAVSHTHSRTVLKEQDSAEAHERDIASIKAPINIPTP